MILADVKQQVIQVVTLYKNYLQNLKYNVKQAHIFRLISVGISSSLMLTVKNRGVGKGFT